MINVNLIQEFTENDKYGISEKEILARTKEKTISLEELKKKL
jgi:hypothetical protein